MEIITGAVCAILGGGAAISGVRYLLQLADTPARRERLEKARYDAQARIAEAQRPTYPHHYAPHIRIDTAAPPAAASPSLPALGIEQDTPALPGAVDLADVPLPPGAVLLGLGAGGEAITTTPAQLMHVAAIGATGSGKTNAARLILAQILAMGRSDVYIANPHHVSNDPDDLAAGDWRTIERRLAAPAAYDDQDIGALLDKLAASVDERWAVKREGRPSGRGQVLYVDELPAIIDQVAGAGAALATILRRGRAVGVYLVSLSQDLATKTLGNKHAGAVRENFRTAVYSGGDPHSAALLLDTPRRELSGYEGDLGRGVALVKAHGRGVALARVPFASNRGVAGLLGDGGGDTVTLPARKTETHYCASERVETVSDGHDYAGIVRRLRAQGHGKKTIIETIWGCKPGGSPAYREASAIYDQVVKGE